MASPAETPASPRTRSATSSSDGVRRLSHCARLARYPRVDVVRVTRRRVCCSMWRDFSKEISEIALTIHRSLARSALLNEHRKADVVAARSGSWTFEAD